MYRSGWRRLGPVTGVLLACATGPDVDVGGSWDFSETYSANSGISCTNTGQLLLAHESGSSLFGGLATRQATCTGAPTDFNPGGSDNVIDAHINGSDVRFQVDLCNYEGTATDLAMSGTVTCELGVSGQPTSFSGTWEASRTAI